MAGSAGSKYNRPVRVEGWEWASASSEDRADYHRLVVARDREVVPQDADMPFDALLADLHVRPPSTRELWWAARDVGGRLAGVAELWWEDTGANEGLANLEVLVRPDARHGGVARELQRVAAVAALRHGWTRLITEIPAASGVVFATRAGWRQFSTERHSRLATASVDRGRLEAWSVPVPGYELLVWEGPTPEEHLEDMAVLRHAENDTPWGDLDVERDVFTAERVRDGDVAYRAGGKERWTAAARFTSGKGIAAYTQLFFWPGWDDYAYQDWTAVDRAHRGLGLAKWVKAVNALRVLGARPAVSRIDTSNNVDNAAMLAINVAMGFRPLFDYGCWTIDTASLAG